MLLLLLLQLLIHCSATFRPPVVFAPPPSTFVRPPSLRLLLFMPTWLCAFIWPSFAFVWRCPHLYSSSRSLAQLHTFVWPSLDPRYLVIAVLPSFVLVRTLLGFACLPVQPSCGFRLHSFVLSRPAYSCLFPSLFGLRSRPLGCLPV